MHRRRAPRCSSLTRKTTLQHARRPRPTTPFTTSLAVLAPRPPPSPPRPACPPARLRQPGRCSLFFVPGAVVRDATSQSHPPRRDRFDPPPAGRAPQPHCAPRRDPIRVAHAGAVACAASPCHTTLPSHRATYHSQHTCEGITSTRSPLQHGKDHRPGSDHLNSAVSVPPSASHPPRAPRRPPPCHTIRVKATPIRKAIRIPTTTAAIRRRRRRSNTAPRPHSIRRRLRWLACFAPPLTV